MSTKLEKNVIKMTFDIRIKELSSALCILLRSPVLTAVKDYVLVANNTQLAKSLFLGPAFVLFLNVPFLGT